MKTDMMKMEPGHDGVLGIGKHGFQMRTVTWGLKLLGLVLGVLLLLALSLFCAFGFLASFEPGNGLTWKVGYGALACGFLAGAAVLVRRAFGGMSDTQASGEGQSTL